MLSVPSNNALRLFILNITRDDYEAVCRLFEEGDALHRNALPEIFRQVSPPRSKEFIESIIGKENIKMLVAECGTELIGLVHFHVTVIADRPMMLPRKFVSVDSLIIQENYRHHGVGKALMENVHQWATTRDISEIELNVYAFNQAAIELYKKLVYETLSYRMRMSAKSQRL